MKRIQSIQLKIFSYLRIVESADKVNGNQIFKKVYFKAFYDEIMHKFIQNLIMLTRILKATKVTKKLYFSEDCHGIINETTKTIERVAAITLGPYGRNVLIQNQMQEPRITKDGVTVVKHIEFENRFEDAVATLVKNSVDNTNKYAGDGTTTSTVLIGEIMKIAYRKIAMGQSTRNIRKGFQIGRNLCLSFLQSSVRKIQTENQLMNVIMISTNKNQKLSQLIFQAMTKAENIKIEKSDRVQNHIQYYSGLNIVRGLESQQFVNDRSGKLIYNYPLVLTSQLPLKNVKSVVRSLQMAKKARKQLIIFSSEISQSVMSTLIFNNKKKIVEVCGISIPEYGQAGKKIYTDVCKTTDSYSFDQFSDQKVEDIDWEHFGKAIKIEVDQHETKIQGKGKKNTNAIIYVGGTTQNVMLQVYDRLVDALNSAQSARKDGIVAGGGITYWKMAQLLEQYKGQGEEGIKILAEALKFPRKKLMQYIHPEKKPFAGENWQGFDIYKQKTVDMFEAGIVDSVNVAKSIIIDSLSLCSVLIEVQVAVARDHANINDVSLKALNKKYSL